MSVDMEWIDLSHDHHGTNETRVRVRSHAMKTTAASRKRTTLPIKKAIAPKKRILRQRPENLCANEITQGESDSSLGDATCANTCTADRLVPVASIRSMPLGGLELLAAETGIHILDISVLTEIQTGWTACTALGAQRSTFTGLSSQKITYVYCLANRYGSNACFDNALRCVAIRAKQVLVPSRQSCDKMEAVQYVTALRSLQKSIDDPEERNAPEVLCAINLLSFFELLHFTRHKAWALHIKGASRLIRSRGPASFKTEFDIRVLLALITPISNECYRDIEPCFFEEESWQNKLQSFVDPTSLFSGNSQLTLNLICIMVRGQRLVRDVNAVVNSRDATDFTELLLLKAKLREYRKELWEWNAEYVLTVMRLPHDGKSPPLATSEDVRGQLLATYYGLLVICSRLMGALSTNLIEELEDEAVSHATQMIKLEKEITPLNQWAAFYIRQRLIVARAVLTTTDFWRGGSGSCSNIIEKDRFNAWVSILAEDPTP